MVELLLFFRYTLDSAIPCKGGKNMNRQIDFLIYRSAEEDLSVNALVKDESIWLTQKAMAELFDCSTDNISLHLKKIFQSGELDKESVTEKISATAADGKNYLTQFYNLDAIISVGYRVNSRRATQFLHSLWKSLLPVSMSFWHFAAITS